MPPKEIIAQIISIVAMAFVNISFLQKKKSILLTCQLIGNGLFSLNFFLLGAMSGALLNGIAVIRAFVFLKKEKLHADNAIWTTGFILSYLASYALVFTVFGKEPTLFNFIIEFMPVIAMISLHLSFRYTDTKMIRRFGLVSGPTWLVYNVVNFSIGAIICESLNIVSILIGMVRNDFKRKEK